MQSSHQTETQIRMMVWTAVVVLLFSGAVVFSLLQPPKTIHLSEKKSSGASPLVAVDPEIGSRGPAAATLEPQYSSVPLDAKNDHQAVELSLPCVKPNIEERSLFNNSVMQVRLTTNCESDGTVKVPTKSAEGSIHRDIASTDIQNQANGFSATVFAQGSQDFTTDYISLAVGENHIHISQLMKSGEHRNRELIIVRQKE